MHVAMTLFFFAIAFVDGVMHTHYTDSHICTNATTVLYDACALVCVCVRAVWICRCVVYACSSESSRTRRDEWMAERQSRFGIDSLLYYCMSVCVCVCARICIQTFIRFSWCFILLIRTTHSAHSTHKVIHCSVFVRWCNCDVLNCWQMVTKKTLFFVCPRRRRIAHTQNIQFLCCLFIW